MKKIAYFLILLFTIFWVTLQIGAAQEMDDLSELSDDSGIDSELSMEDAEEDEQTEESESDNDSEISVNIGGYTKGLAYWNEEKYTDSMWERYQLLAGLTKPSPREREQSGFNNVGSRIQLKIEGFLGEHARLFTAFNFNFNLATGIHDRDDTYERENLNESQQGDVRLVENYVEIYEGSRTWKMGSQIVTWSFLEGMVVPTDRVNARDYSYKSTEYEDIKLSSTGLLLIQSIFESQLELFYIPIAKVNVNQPFMDYFFESTEYRDDQKLNNSKWAVRFNSTVGNLDYAISYLEGLDPRADLKSEANPNVPTVLDYYRMYNRIKSPGLDLQYNLGSWLLKGSFVQYITEDSSGEDPNIKNNWNQYVVGAEFNVGGNTINFYAGQTLVENFPKDDFGINNSFLMGQIRERTDFISGHINASFLPGDALNLILMASNSWDDEGESVQTNIRTTIKYKIANGLELLVSPSYGNMLDNEFSDLQTEIKYSF